jgi:hypothetical protein
LLASAFTLWGIGQLLPPSGTTAVLGDVVIVFYRVDLSLVIKTTSNARIGTPLKFLASIVLDYGKLSPGNPSERGV